MKTKSTSGTKCSVKDKKNPNISAGISETITLAKKKADLFSQTEGEKTIPFSRLPSFGPGEIKFVENPKKEGLSAQDICSILKEAGKAGVSSLKFGELFIEFAQKQSGISQSPQRNVEEHSRVSAETDEPSTVVPLDLEQEQIIEEHQQMMDDPVGFEEDMIRVHQERQRTLNA